MIAEYIQKSLENAEYKKLEDGTWYAEILGFKGVWANGKNVEECRKELSEVIEEWILLKIKDNESIPELKGVKLNIKELIKT
jgi:predicted RNase H-like HicB family nuclease